MTDKFEEALAAFGAAQNLPTKSSPSVSLLQEGAAEAKPFYWSDCTSEEYTAILAAFEPLEQAHKWPIEKAFKAILSRIKAADLSQYQQERGGLPEGWVAVPVKPSDEHLASMATRNSHDYSLKVKEAQARMRASMLQLYEEATGQGFYKISSPPTPVAIEEGGDWISVDERLPELAEGCDSVECNVLSDDGRVSTADYRQQRYAKTSKGRAPRWERHYRLWWGRPITHWQPLPTAPAKKEAHNG